MTQEAQSLLDAVSAGIGEADGTSAPEPKETADENAGSVGDEHGNGSGSEENEGAGSEGTSEAADGEDGASSDAENDGAAGDGSDAEAGEGTDSKKAGAKNKAGAEGTPAKAEGAAATDSVDTVKAAKEKLDKAVNDPIDQRLKETTRERIQLLANEVKTMRPMLDNANTLFGAIDDTGMTPDELATMLGYARIRHHGSIEDKRQALGFLRDELRALAIEVGDTDAVDLLAEHQDLQDAVANNQLTAEYAREVALARGRTQRDTQATAAATAQTEAQQAHNSGVQAINQTAQALFNRDGAEVFNAKRAILTATLKPVLARLPPHAWAQTFQQAYDAMPKPTPAAPAAPIAPAAPVVKQQPLRPATPAGGGGKKEPKSMKEAVFAAFDSAE